MINLSVRRTRCRDAAIFARTCGSLAAIMVVTTAAAQPRPIVGPQVRIDVGGGTAIANETTCSVGEANPMEIVAGWNDRRLISTFNSAFALSQDGGQTWTDYLIRPPVEYQAPTEGDPFTAFDPRTGTLWAGAMAWNDGSVCIYVARKDPGASEFHPSVVTGVAPWMDKPWMVAGPRPGEPDSTRLYITYNEGVIWSDDMGDSWTSPLPLGTGVGFLPRIGPGGEVYVAYYDYGTQMRLRRSLNGGGSFSYHTIATRMDAWGTQDSDRFPGRFRVPPLVYMDVDQNTGHLYAAYSDVTEVVDDQFNVDIYFTKSTDMGKSWSTPVVMNSDADPPGDQFFSWLEADKDGRLHMLSLDTRYVAQEDQTLHGMIDAHYSYSVNGGETWMEFRITPESWDSDDSGYVSPGQFIGDYLGMGVAGNRAYPAYPDTTAGDPDIFTNIIEIPLMGDVDFDGIIDVLDLLEVLEQWGECADPDGCVADLDGSGFIDVLDLLEVLANWT